MFSFSAYFASVEQNQPELGTRQHRRDNETMLHTKTFLLIALHAWLYSFWLLHLNTKAHLSTFCSSLKAITYCHVDVVAKLRNCRIPSSGISSCICACWVLACYNFLAGGCRWQHGQSGSLHTYNSSLCGTQTNSLWSTQQQLPAMGMIILFQSWELTLWFSCESLYKSERTIHSYIRANR